MHQTLVRSVLIGLCGFLGAIAGTMIGGSGGAVPGAKTFLVALLTGLSITIITALLITAYQKLNKGREEGSPLATSLHEAITAYTTIAASLIFVGIAYLVSLGTGVSPHATFSVNTHAIAWGIGAIIPMLAILIGLEKIPHPAITAFREKQTAYFANLGFRFTPLRILLMSLGAGIGEELLFRGALQGWLVTHMHTALAILLPSVVFGLMHSANRIYMIIAGLIGIYLGGIFVISGNILAPIVAHTLYDIVALAYTARLIKAWQNRNNAIDDGNRSSTPADI